MVCQVYTGYMFTFPVRSARYNVSGVRPTLYLYLLPHVADSRGQQKTVISKTPTVTKQYHDHTMCLEVPRYIN